MAEEKIRIKQLFKAGLIQEEKGKPFQDDLRPILKHIELNKKLSTELRDYLYLYLSLENFIINSNLGYTQESLRALIKEKFNTQWFSPRLRALFNLKYPDHLIFTEIILESVLKHLSQNVDINHLQRIINSLTKNALLRDIIATKETISFDVLDRRIFLEENAEQALKNIHKVLVELHKHVAYHLGASTTKEIFNEAFNEVKNKYGDIPKFTDTIKTLPHGILEEERLELLTKEELEKTSRRLAEIEFMKSEFTNIAAHELQTPLTPIRIYITSMLKNKKTNMSKKEKEKLKICLRNVKRLQSLIDDILDISKLEAGEMKFDMEKLDITELIKHVKQDQEFLAKEKGLNFYINTPKKMPLVQGDERRLTQVIENLIKNSIKFTEKGSITINAKQKGKNIEVNVQDTGIGIDKENMSKLFNKFFQAEPSATRTKSGTGLGLAICKEIIEAHNGKIDVESVRGKGSVFKFEIPKAK